MRRRVVRLAVVTALFALLIFGAPLAVAVRIVFVNDERGELTRIAERAASSVSPDALRGADPIELPAAEQDTQIGVYDGRASRVAGAGPAVGDAPVFEALAGHLTDTAGGGRLLIAAPIRDGEQVVGAVRVTSSERSANLRTLAAWAGMTGLAALAAGAAAVLAGIQAGRLTGPLSQLARAAHALGDGNFAVREKPSGIPEVDAVATALADTAARIEDLLARERAFSTRASHQLRTPLTGLRLTLEAALAGGDTGLRTAAASAVDSADVLARTIDELLLLTRAPGRSEPLDTEALLADLDRERTGSLAAQGRPLRIESESGLPRAAASRAAVKQVLAVLLDNAAEHGAGTITIRARAADTGLALDVTDEGEGFAGPSGSPDGAAPHGLGLPLARALAEAEGGRLVITRPGPHPVLTLFLPAPDPAENPAPDPAARTPDA